jgi:hypothetical protein
VQLQRLSAYHEKQQARRNAAGRKPAVAPIAIGLRRDGQSYVAVQEGKSTGTSAPIECRGSRAFVRSQRRKSHKSRPVITL